MANPKHGPNGSFSNSSRKINLSEYSSPPKLTSQSTSPSKYRETHGIEKFYITQERKNANKEVELINNRINQLIKFEEKAKRKIDLAQQKTELIYRAKDRHTEDIREKEQQKALKRLEEEDQRRRNREEKERRVMNTKNYQEMILNEKRALAKETKRQSKELDALQKHFKMLVEQQKNERKNIRYTEVIEHKQRKDLTQNHYSVSLKEEYEKRIAQEKAVHIDLINQKKELEKYEAEIVQSLANTELNEVEAMKNLETLAKVSLFHLGLRP